MGRRLTEEQKKKMAEGRKKAQERKEAEARDGLKAPTVPLDAEEIVVTEEKKVSEDLKKPDVDENFLMKTILQLQQQVQELQSTGVVQNATPEQKFDELSKVSSSTARVGQNGIQGIIFKYEVDKGYYPDPTERLLNEPKLQRFAMHDNYIFKWDVDGVEYKKDNITYAEPRFTVELYRRLFDEEGNDTGRAALVARNMLHEDEMTTRVSASRLGILDNFSNDEEGFRLLMNEIRYWRIQQWLFGIFAPPKVNTFQRKATTQVIDGKVVEVFDTETITDAASASSQVQQIRG